MNKLLLTGGSGTLGSEIIKICKKNKNIFFAPSSREMDITNIQDVRQQIEKHKPNVIIHMAAYTDIRKAEKEVKKLINTNILGTVNIINACIENDIRLVYISSDHVFDGEEGNYTPKSKINPITKYAKSKAAAETAVRICDNSLVIRTSFFPNKFPYDAAFTDQWSSKDYVDIIAPKIYKQALSLNTGIVHCCSSKRTIYDIVRTRMPNVKTILRKDIDFFTLKDTSLLKGECENE